MTEIDMLMRLFDTINDIYYKSVVPPTYIRFSFAKKRINWSLKKLANGTLYISINWQMAALPEKELYMEMIHQMAHLYNQAKDIEDTSMNNVYHNGSFRKAVEMCGGKARIVDSHKGYRVTNLSKKTMKTLQKYFNYQKYIELINKRGEEVFVGSFARFRYPQCGRVIEAQRLADNIICGYCHRNFIKID